MTSTVNRGYKQHQQIGAGGGIYIRYKELQEGLRAASGKLTAGPAHRTGGNLQFEMDFKGIGEYGHGSESHQDLGDTHRKTMRLCTFNEH